MKSRPSRPSISAPFRVQPIRRSACRCLRQGGFGDVSTPWIPAAVHIATEGPLGLAARRWCLRRGRSFTTSYHTQFPEYVRARVPIPVAVSYAFLRWFHGSAAHTLVATPSMQNALAERGFRNLVPWSRGVDTDLFRPRDEPCLELPRPIWLYFGRVSVEKGIEEFLALDLPGSKTRGR